MMGTFEAMRDAAVSRSLLLQGGATRRALRAANSVVDVATIAWVKAGCPLPESKAPLAEVEALKARIEAKEQQWLDLKERRGDAREATQAIIACIGAIGPESLPSAVARIIARVETLESWTQVIDGIPHDQGALAGWMSRATIAEARVRELETELSLIYGGG